MDAVQQLDGDDCNKGVDYSGRFNTSGVGVSLCMSVYVCVRATGAGGWGWRICNLFHGRIS